MNESALIAVKLRLDTAGMALQSASHEIGAPSNDADKALAKTMLEAMWHIGKAQIICDARLNVVNEQAT